MPIWTFSLDNKVDLSEGRKAWTGKKSIEIGPNREILIGPEVIRRVKYEADHDAHLPEVGECDMVQKTFNVV